MSNGLLHLSSHDICAINIFFSHKRYASFVAKILELYIISDLIIVLDLELHLSENGRINLGLKKRTGVTTYSKPYFYGMLTGTMCIPVTRDGLIWERRNEIEKFL